MRIFSKQNDYYDNVVGFSDSPIWERKTTEIILDKTKKDIDLKTTNFLLKIWEDLPKPSYVADRTWRKDCGHIAILGFCGKLIPIFRTNIEKNKFDSSLDKLKTFDKASEFIEAFNKVNYYKVNENCGFFTKRKFDDKI